LADDGREAADLTALDFEFERAARDGTGALQKAAQIPAQQSEANGDKMPQTSTPNIEKTQELAENEENIRKRASPRGARNPATLPEGSTREYAHEAEVRTCIFGTLNRHSFLELLTHNACDLFDWQSSNS
jgi:hypothetical protein